MTVNMNIKLIYLAVLCGLQVASAAWSFTDMQTQIQSQINPIVEEIKSQIAQIQNRINEYTSTFNNAISGALKAMEGLRNQTEAALQKGVAQLGNIITDVSSCMKTGRGKISEIYNESRSEVEAEAARQQEVFNPVIGEINGTISKAVALVGNLTRDMQNCGMNFACRIPVLSTALTMSPTVGNELMQEGKDLQTIFPQVFSSLGPALSSIAQNAGVKYSAVVQETIQCVQNQNQNTQ